MAGITWPKQSQPSKARMQDVCGREGGMATTAFLFVSVEGKKISKRAGQRLRHVTVGFFGSHESRCMLVFPTHLQPISN